MELSLHMKSKWAFNAFELLKGEQIWWECLKVHGVFVNYFT